MVIIDFLSSCHTIKVKGQQVPVVNLQEKEGELGSWKQFKLERLALFHQISLYTALESIQLFIATG